MDWERRFSSIVNDTETNLDRIKQRLSDARMTSSLSLHNLNTNHTGSVPYETSLVPFDTATLKPSLNDTIKSATDEVMDRQIATLDSSAIITTLTDQIHAQYKAIENLSKAVHRLEREKLRQDNHMKVLSNELMQLKQRLHESGVNLATEEKIETWRRDMNQELQTMHGQLIRLHASDEYQSLQHNEYNKLTKEMYDMKRRLEDDVHEVRRDVDLLKNKTMKMEIDVSNLMSEFKHCTRQGDHHDKMLSKLLESNSSTKLNVDKKLYNITRDKQALADMRSEMQELQEKLKRVESHSKKLQKDFQEAGSKSKQSAAASHRSTKHATSSRPSYCSTRRPAHSRYGADEELVEYSDEDSEIDAYLNTETSYALNLAANHVDDLNSSTDLDVTNTEDLLSLDLDSKYFG